ncbi:MAG TPA: hypothetical protein PKM69_09320, partial [Bacteroidales bacterium]|nr:hypothetical protein [Bacteroidales bacterium]
LHCVLNLLSEIIPNAIIVNYYVLKKHEFYLYNERRFIIFAVKIIRFINNGATTKVQENM